MAAGCATYVLIGSDHSLFTGKLRVYLMYKGIPFEQMTASRDVYLQVIVPRTGVTFIPVLVCPDRTTVLQDTHAIIRNLEQRFPQHPILPSTPCQSLTSQLLELYGDEWLVLPAMHYRWSFPEQLQLLLYQFGATNSPTAPYKQQLAIGRKVSDRFSSMLPALGITEASIPAIQSRFQWQLAVLQHHLQQHRFLLSDSRPCSGEFGLMGALFAHLFKDPVPQAIIKMHAPLVANWIERVCGLSGVRVQAGYKALVALRPQNPAQLQQGTLAEERSEQQLPVKSDVDRTSTADSGSTGSSSTCSTSSRSGSGSGSNLFLPGDAVPLTLLPLLYHMFQEQIPVVISTLRQLQLWIRQQQQQQLQGSGTENDSPNASSAAKPSQLIADGWLTVPRNLGSVCFTLFDPVTGQQMHQGTRAATSYVAWRAALIINWFDELPESDRQSVLGFLHTVGKGGQGGIMSGTMSASSPANRSAIFSAATEGRDNGESLVGDSQVVDAVATFLEMRDLVRSCGVIGRVRNRVAVRPTGELGLLMSCDRGSNVPQPAAVFSRL